MEMADRRLLAHRLARYIEGNWIPTPKPNVEWRELIYDIWRLSSQPQHTPLARAQEVGDRALTIQKMFSWSSTCLPEVMRSAGSVASSWRWLSS